MASVLITGTSKGIGLETALAFGRSGYTVFATMRNPLGSPELAERAAQEELPITIHPMDVDSDESVRDAMASVQEKHGPIDVLVNNAGIERVGAIEELPLAEFRAAMETNYFGALRCIQAAVPQMRERRSGWIINLTSVAGRIATPPLAPYCSSKWALEALSEALAGEMKMFNVHVAIVEPGIIDTAHGSPDLSRWPSVGLSPEFSYGWPVRRFAAETSIALRGGGESRCDRVEWRLAAALSGWLRCRLLHRLAARNDR